MYLFTDRKILSKFLLFAAYNNTITEEKTGLVTRRGVTPDISRSFLKFENFQSKIYETVEHVAPQSPNNPDSWKGIYSENKVNSIGNLILIPKLQNINLSNHNWSVKKPFLKAMSTSNIDERKKLFKEASDAGLNLSAQRINYLVNYETSSELLKGLSDTNEWDVNFVKNRSKRLLELAWDELAKWLKPEKK